MRVMFAFLLIACFLKPLPEPRREYKTASFLGADWIVVGAVSGFVGVLNAVNGFMLRPAQTPQEPEDPDGSGSEVSSISGYSESESVNGATRRASEQILRINMSVVAADILAASYVPSHEPEINATMLVTTGVVSILALSNLHVYNRLHNAGNDSAATKIGALMNVMIFLASANVFLVAGLDALFG